VIGHIPLIELRKSGVRPEVVYLSDEVSQIVRDWHAPRTLTGKRMVPHAPHIAILPEDRLQTLDLRFLVGLDVRISSDDETRAKAMFEACKRAGASRVVGCQTQPDRHYTDQSGWIEIYEKVKNA
jgi:hypothetical protein